MCGLHSSRNSKALIHDLQLIRDGRQQDVSIFNWKQTMLTYQPEITLGMYTVNWGSVLSFVYLPEQIQHTIKIENIPGQLQKAIDEYNTVGYTLMPGVLTPQQIHLAVKELNYQTLGRGVDLLEPSTWYNVTDLHDWKQGWAKWLFCSGIQVYCVCLCVCVCVCVCH